MKKYNCEKEITCETGLEKEVITKEVFDREIKLCQKLSKKNGEKCGWGECKKCGVVLLLHKLYKGKIIDKAAEIKKAKKGIVK
jgi:hypothetical protein